MGLDISAYKNIKLANCQYNSDGEPIDENGEYRADVTKLYINHNFPGRADEIEDRKAYEYEGSIGFRAGSYGGYNNWRETLAKLAGYPAIPYGDDVLRHDAGVWECKEGPFWELICFSDCEGVIGSTISAKLAKDFAEYQGIVDSTRDEYFKEQYSNWRKAFEMASQNGAVSFH